MKSRNVDIRLVYHADGAGRKRKIAEQTDGNAPQESSFLIILVVNKPLAERKGGKSKEHERYVGTNPVFEIPVLKIKAHDDQQGQPGFEAQFLPPGNCQNRQSQNKRNNDHAFHGDEVNSEKVIDRDEESGKARRKGHRRQEYTNLISTFRLFIQTMISKFAVSNERNSQ